MLSIVKHISVLNNVLGSHQVTNDQKYSCIVRDGQLEVDLVSPELTLLVIRESGTQCLLREHLSVEHLRGITVENHSTDVRPIITSFTLLVLDATKRIQFHKGFLLLERLLLLY